MGNNIHVEMTENDFKDKDSAEQNYILYKCISSMQLNCNENCEEFNKRIGKLENRKKIDLGTALGTGGMGGVLLTYLKTKLGL